MCTEFFEYFNYINFEFGKKSQDKNNNNGIFISCRESGEL